MTNITFYTYAEEQRGAIFVLFYEKSSLASKLRQSLMKLMLKILLVIKLPSLRIELGVKQKQLGCSKNKLRPEDLEETKLSRALKQRKKTQIYDLSAQT